MKQIIFIFCVIFILIFGLGRAVETQSPTPAPGSFVLPAGAGNIGRVQPISMDRITVETGISDWRNAGWTGRGQRIGVLDQGFGELANFEMDNNISVRLSSGTDKVVYNDDPITHGTDIIRVIHRIAPAAELYACKYLTFNEYVACIDWMIASGVKIINHSMGVPALPLDGTSQWSREVDRAAQSGILWVNAAGNFAGGYISDFFTDNNPNTYHEFRGEGIIESLSVEPIDQIGRIMLSWQGNTQYRAEEIDLDLEVIDAEMNIIAQSSNSQSGNIGELPLEIAQINMNQPFGVRVRNTDGRGERVSFVLFIEFTTLQAGISRESVISPGDSLNALTVGAMKMNYVAPYSSQGPLATGDIKPDLLAPGEVLLPNGKQFIGTSAAASIISGVAALIWEARPSMTRAQIFEYIRAAMTLDDHNIRGPDGVYGWGYLYMALPETIADSIYTPSPCPTVTPTAIRKTY